MRKTMKCFPLALIALFILFCNPSYAILTDWGLSLEGNGENINEISEFLDVTGSNFAKNTPETNFNDNPNFTFDNWGFLQSITHDGGPSYSPSGYEFTGIFYGEGTGQLGDKAYFESGSLDLYAHNDGNYATDTDDPIYYGSNDGTLIAQFNLKSGKVEIGDNAFPTGQTALNFESTFLKEGHWFDSDGNDLSETEPIQWILGLSTTTANTINSPSDTLLDEMNSYSNLTWPDGNNQPYDIEMSSNGQFRLAQVPEPTTMLLMGTGLLGLGYFGRRKFMNMNKKA